MELCAKNAGRISEQESNGDIHHFFASEIPTPSSSEKSLDFEPFQPFFSSDCSTSAN
jgi:hypothetical protein